MEHDSMIPVNVSQNHHCFEKDWSLHELNFAIPITDPITKNNNIGSSRMYCVKVRVPISKGKPAKQLSNYYLPTHKNTWSKVLFLFPPLAYQIKLGKHLWLLLWVTESFPTQCRSRKGQLQHPKEYKTKKNHEKEISLNTRSHVKIIEGQEISHNSQLSFQHSWHQYIYLLD